jgi:hypothetical protein
MATAQEIERAIAILATGRAAEVGIGTIRAAQLRAAERKIAFRALSRPAQAKAVAIGAGRVGKFAGKQLITKNPWGVAAYLAYEGIIHRDEIGQVALDLGAAGGELIRGERGDALTATTSRRKVSKANRAVKHAMGLLKAGPKRSTGADKGKLVKGAFKLATKAAGLANPKTKSKIGKGKGRVKALARKLRKWW